MNKFNFNLNSSELAIDPNPSPRAKELAIMFDELSETDQAYIAHDIKRAFKAVKQARQNDRLRLVEAAR
jgi:hypothetical protein